MNDRLEALHCHGYRLLCHMPDAQHPDVIRAIYARGTRLFHVDHFTTWPKERPDAQDVYPADMARRLIAKSGTTVVYDLPEPQALAIIASAQCQTTGDS